MPRPTPPRWPARGGRRGTACQPRLLAAQAARPSRGARRWSCAATRSASPSRCSAMLLMLVMGYGISLDVEDLFMPCSISTARPRAARLPRQLQGIRELAERAPATSSGDIDARLLAGELELCAGASCPASAPGCAPGAGLRSACASTARSRSAFRDRARLPCSASTPASSPIRVRHSSGRHRPRRRRHLPGSKCAFRWQPGLPLVNAIVPGVLALLLLAIPATLTALGVVREKEPRLDHQSVREPGDAARIPARRVDAFTPASDWSTPR